MKKSGSINLDEHVKQLIEQALNYTNGNINETAEYLQIKKSRLLEELKYYEITPSKCTPGLEIEGRRAFENDEGILDASNEQIRFGRDDIMAFGKRRVISQYYTRYVIRLKDNSIVFVRACDQPKPVEQWIRDHMKHVPAPKATRDDPVVYTWSDQEYVKAPAEHIAAPDEDFLYGRWPCEARDKSLYPERDNHRADKISKFKFDYTRIIQFGKHRSSKVARYVVKLDAEYIAGLDDKYTVELENSYYGNSNNDRFMFDDNRDRFIFVIGKEQTPAWLSWLRGQMKDIKAPPINFGSKNQFEWGPVVDWSSQP